MTRYAEHAQGHQATRGENVGHQRQEMRWESRPELAHRGGLYSQVDAQERILNLKERRQRGLSR